MHERSERLLSVALVLSAVALAVSVIHREFATRPMPTAPPPLDQPAFVAAWMDALPVGIEIGNRAATIKVVEFADLECPFCRGFHAVMRDVMKEHPKDVSLVFVHFPLDSHRFARQAAQAVECADARGRVSELVDLVYTKQDSIGMKSWGSYAQDAGIKDTAAFRQCALNPTMAKRIEAGKGLADRMHINGTPTVFVNGWRYGRAPGREELEQIVRTVLKGGSPVDSLKTRKSE